MTWQDVRELLLASADDMREVAALLPVPDDRAETTARMCDRLSEEAAQAAAWLRRSQIREVPERPALPKRRVPADPASGGVHRIPPDPGRPA
ncbi:MAG TPA: hypothetical protein VMV92_25340 [Streptosporangiaceae bacterium]|nr:hypothetical protein [Streptosporangiaceae bacterium]